MADKPVPVDEAARKIFERVVKQHKKPRHGGLIPPPEWALNRRIDALEARLAKLEKRLSGE